MSEIKCVTMSRHRIVRTMNYSDGKCQMIKATCQPITCITTKWKHRKRFGEKITIFIVSEYDGYDDVYGHSVDEEPSCISPTDAQQWIYDRNRGQQSVSSFIANNRDIEEEDEDAEAVADELHKKSRRDSEVIMRCSFSSGWVCDSQLHIFRRISSCQI